jgi:mitochondrial fission protein ELM1
MIMGCTDKHGPYFWTNFKGAKQEQLRQMLKMNKEEFRNIPFLKFNQGFRTLMAEMVQQPKYKDSFLVKHLETN